MEKKEKVLDFNHRFTHHLNNFSAAIIPAEETALSEVFPTLNQHPIPLQ